MTFVELFSLWGCDCVGRFSFVPILDKTALVLVDSWDVSFPRAPFWSVRSSAALGGSGHLQVKYLLIDFENVQPRSLEMLHGHNFKVKLFVGAKQTKVSLDLARALQGLGEDAEYVQISGNGRNALDFHIAYTLGELSAQQVDALFYVVSKDTGFDPLIKFLKGKGVCVQRVRDVADLPVPGGPKGKSLEEKVEVVVANLKSRGSGRPRKVRTLKSTVNALFGKALPESEIVDLIGVLEREGYIAVENQNVSYHLQDTA